MAYQAIGRGTSANDGTGDDLRTGAGKLNANFVEVYTYLGDGSSLSSDPVVTETATQTLTNKTITGTFNGPITGNITGNADTATALQTARTIAGQSFDGTGNVTIAATDLSDTDQSLATTDSVTFVGVTATTFTGDITGDVTGDINSSGSSVFSGSINLAGATVSNAAFNLTGNLTGNVTGDVTGNVDYTPSAGGQWATAPTTTAQAIDMLAAAVYTLNGSTPI